MVTNNMKKYKISIEGYGAEVTIGSVNEEQKMIINNSDKELWETASEDLEETGWYAIDDQYHKFGASSDWTISIEDENGEKIYEIKSDNIDEYDTDDFELVEYNTIEVDEDKDLLMCVSQEKGTFFEGDILTEDSFDITKLKIKIDEEIEIDECYFGEIISGVYYNDEEIDNYGGSTDCKSFIAAKNF